MFYPLGKKLEKTQGEVATTPPPHPCTSEGLLRPITISLVLI